MSHNGDKDTNKIFEIICNLIKRKFTGKAKFEIDFANGGIRSIEFGQTEKI